MVCFESICTVGINFNIVDILLHSCVFPTVPGCILEVFEIPVPCVDTHRLQPEVPSKCVSSLICIAVWPVFIAFSLSTKSCRPNICTVCTV